MDERPEELHVPLSGPCVELTLKLRSFTLSFRPPGSAIVRRIAVRRVVLRLRVVTRRLTVLVRRRLTAGRAVLRRRDVALLRVANRSSSAPVRGS